MRLLETAFGDEGLRVPGETDPRDLGELETVDSITVVFGGFRDGRGFSLGSMLRQQGFAGELRAAGDLLPDHAPMLARCGFDAAELPVGASAAEWERQLASFSAVYQPAADGAPTVWALRQSQISPSSSGPAQREPGDPAAPALNAANLEPSFPQDSLLGPRVSAPAGLRSEDDEHSEKKQLVARLNAEYRDAPPEVILDAAIHELFPGRIAVLSSFGAEAAVGLHLAAGVEPAVPVLFLDTERHFDPTLQYRDRLTKQLGLTDVRTLKPRAPETVDTRGDLWRTNPDACCDLRKVQPLAAVAPDFDALITGRKRFHGGLRVRLPVFELLEGQIRVNPLANWGADEIEAHFVRHDLPRHPLTQGGYRSIGCWPCTQPSSDEEDVRAGRWSGLDKTECGIHMPERWAPAAERRAS